MGCSASIPQWQAAVTEGWPRFTFSRVQLQNNGEYTIEFQDSMLRILTVPYKTQNGYVSVKSVNAFSATFAAPDARIAYNPNKKDNLPRTLVGDNGVYSRQVVKSREIGPADVSWSLTSSVRSEEDDVAPTLPSKLTVVNADNRVLVWKGARPTDAADAASRGPSDLLARILSADSGTDASAPGRRFEIEVSPTLLRTAASHPGELPLFLAMATEAYWAQGARCFASNVVGVRAESVVADASDVRPNSSVVRDTFNGKGGIMGRNARVGAAASSSSSAGPIAVGVKVQSAERE